MIGKKVCLLKLTKTWLSGDHTLVSFSFLTWDLPVAQGSSAHTLQKRQKGCHHAYREFPKVCTVCAQMWEHIWSVDTGACPSFNAISGALGRVGDSPFITSDLLTKSYHLFLVCAQVYQRRR